MKFGIQMTDFDLCQETSKPLAYIKNESHKENPPRNRCGPHFYKSPYVFRQSAAAPVQCLLKCIPLESCWWMVVVDCVVRNACDMGAPMEDSHKGGRLRGKWRDPLNESNSIVINRQHAL